MALIETKNGPIEETLLERREGVIDDARRYGMFVEHLLQGVIVRRDEATYWEKVNPFADPPPSGKILAEIQEAARETREALYAILPGSREQLDGHFVPGGGVRFECPIQFLDRIVLTRDAPGEFSSVVEYRVKGDTTETIVHRSADTKLKKATVTGFGIAGTLGG